MLKAERSSRRSYPHSLATLLALTAAAVALLSVVAPAGSKYLFEVPDESVRVRINGDSSLDIWYRVGFKNDPTGDPIDIVDIGMPTTDFKPAECEASIDGVALQGGLDIRGSEVLKDAAGAHLGVEIDLGVHAIQPGESGVVEFRGRVPRMVFQDTVREGYASVEFKNTWWGAEYARGNTVLTISVEFPPGVRRNETVYHGSVEPSRSEVDGRIAFTWVWTDALPTRGYLVGVSFPAVYVSGVYPRQPPPDYSPVYTPTDSAYSGYSGTGPWEYLVYIIPMVIIVLLRTFGSLVRFRRKGVKIRYVAPAVGVEGAGPMTELAPAEAAVLMGQDLDRMAAIAYFEMLRKGLVAVTSREPLVLSRAAAGSSTPGYLSGFLAAVSPEGTLDGDTLRIALTSLIKGVEEKTRGFSHADTVSYYEEASRNAWAEVRSAADHSARMEAFDRNLPLLLLDPGFGSKVREAFGAGEFPVDARALVIMGSAVGAERIRAGAPGAAITVSGSEFAESVAGCFRAFQDAAFEHSRDFEKELVKDVNPKEYRRVYRPYLGYRAGGYGGGGACACACACAGCACACAGGGR